MKKALIVIALVIVFFSYSVSAVPFKLAVGKQGFRSIDVWSVNPFNFEFNFQNKVFVDYVAMEAFKEYNRCNGGWYAEVFDDGKLVQKTNVQDVCTRSLYEGAGCWRTPSLFLEQTDSVVIKSIPSQRSTCSNGNCHPSIKGNVVFIEGNVVSSAITSRSGIIELGVLGDILKDVSYKETVGDDIIIKPSNPRVLAWIGSQNDYDLVPLVDKTKNEDLDIKHVWACYDGDLNKKCDYNENVDCLKEKGDYYKGVCCGTDITECSYVSFFNGKLIDSFCSKLDNGYWAWISKDNKGEIFDLDSGYCPADNLISDGSVFFSEDKSFNYYIETGPGSSSPAVCAPGFDEIDYFSSGSNLAPNSDIKKQYRVCGKEEQLDKESVFVKTNYGEHEYISAVGELFECAVDFPFSTHNNASLGSNTNSLSGLVCPSGMLVYYPMENSVNNFASGFMNGQANDISFIDGKSGSAVLFNGKSSDIEISAGSVNFHKIGFEAWIKPSVASSEQIIFNNEMSAELYLNNKTLMASLYTDDFEDGVFLESSVDISIDKWSYVVLSYDGSFAKLYLNGLEVDSTPLTGRLKVSSYPFIIGARSFIPNAFFNGLIDEVVIYGLAISDSLIQEHYSLPGSYCGTSSFDEIFYCASDGDWTKDLDIKDSVSCNAAGFDWTGHKCCSEDDDPGESYSDYSIDAVNINNIITSRNNADLVSDYEVILNNKDSFVNIKGPANILITRQYLRSERGEKVKCLDKDDILLSYDLKEGDSKKIFNLFYPEESVCKFGRTIVSSRPFLASGGCFNKRFYQSGSFLHKKNIINYQGEFIACKTIPDSYKSYDFISVKESHCGYPLFNITPVEHAVCLPDGSWYLTKDSGATVVDDTLWNPVELGVSGAVKLGCCPENQCWNGTGCQPVDTFYRVKNHGFVCK
ncbi:LamG domain-containing protein [Candidatus Woesearchaeota archaeon]|nr:LamG domain-containing protein [Candidatus Woesearchaeota archaeon]